MTQADRTLSRALALAACCACALALGGTWATAADDAGEKKITIDQVPAAPREAILKAVGNGKIVDIGEVSEGGKVVCYEVECVRDSREIDIVVAPDGKLLGTEDQGPGAGGATKPAPVEIVKGKLTAEAAATVRKTWPKATVKAIGVEPADGMQLHKVELEDGGKEMEAEIAPDGTLVSTQADVGQEELPAELREAIRKAVADGKLIKIEKEVISATVASGAVEPLVAAQVLYTAKVARDGALSEVMLAPDGSPARKAGPWRSAFTVDKKDLVNVGRNLYFPLVPGHRIHLAGGGETVVITVLDETKLVDGVQTRVVEERETKRGKLAEVSRNYFAMDKNTNDVYYFGEDVDDYDAEGKVAGHGGAWLSGVNGARFGLMMPGKPEVGDRYYQEVAPKVAMDRAEVVKLTATLETPMKTFKGCLFIRESSPLEGGFSYKWYVAGVGMIGDDELRIVKVEGPLSGAAKE